MVSGDLGLLLKKRGLSDLKDRGTMCGRVKDGSM